jgi:D-hydroxyproline dehydrogenase subunit beta
VTRVVVVGAGLLGASVADELAARGADVTVVDRAEPGGGTSGSSFAWINAQDKTPTAYFELNAQGVRAYPTLAAELGGDWYHPGGDVAIGRGAGATKLAERIERHRALGYAVRELDRAGLAELERDLVLPADGDLKAAHFPDEAWIDAPALIARLLARATERGATVRTGTAVSGFEVSGGHAEAAVTDAGRLPSDVVVLVAGPASEGLAALAGVRLPMAPNPGLLATVRPERASLSHVVHAGDVAMRPAAEGGIVLSSREVDATLDPSTRELDRASTPVLELLARGGKVVPGVSDAGIATVRVGVRSVAVDGFPVAGFSPAVENLYVLIAHSGATLAPVLGRLAASEVLGGREQRLEDYRPARFG